MINGIRVVGVAEFDSEVNMVTLEWYKQWLPPREVHIHRMDAVTTDGNGAETPCLGYVKIGTEVENKSKRKKK